ncbi:MAG: SRPBCC domain-containing protein [Sphingobacteriales bacterium]|nr:SRPBCC domain-containing protein [Sphingobacteriales bacterium]
MQTKTLITVEALINAPVQKVWAFFNGPEHVTKWNQASPDWYCPKASSELKPGGKFSCTMAAKDGSFSFDFGGTYREVVPEQKLSIILEDDRKWDVHFSAKGNQTLVVETFEAEEENPVEMQRMGWQSILDSFKQYTETPKP